MSEYGSLHIDDDRLVLRFERRFSQPIDRVWRAVTDPDEMKAWFPSNVEGERTVGAELVFSYDVVDQTDPELPDPENLPLFGGEVLRFDAPHLFEFTWGGRSCASSCQRTARAPASSSARSSPIGRRPVGTDPAGTPAWLLSQFTWARKSRRSMGSRCTTTTSFGSGFLSGRPTTTVP